MEVAKHRTENSIDKHANSNMYSLAVMGDFTTLQY